MLKNFVAKKPLAEKVACAKAELVPKESDPGYCVAKAERVLEVSARAIGKMPVESEPSELSTLI